MVFWKSDSLHVDLQDLKQHRTLIIVTAVGLIILGTLALLTTVYTTLGTVLFIGSLLLASGVLQVVQAFDARKWKGFFFHCLLGVLNGVAGALIIYNPVGAALSITLLLGGFFIASGIFRIFAALGGNFYHWGWILANGLMTLLLGILILKQWPLSGFWVIGLFVGIDLIMSGWTMLVLGNSIKK